MTLSTRLILSALAALALSAPALASGDDAITATPQRTSKAIEAEKAEKAAEKDAFSKRVGDYLGTVHGEVSAMVDTEGGYSVSGTAVLPLGENGVAVITLSKGEGPGWWGYPYGYGYYREPPLGGGIRRLP